MAEGDDQNLPGGALARRPEDRLAALTGAADAPARVAAMPVTDLYYLIKELGLEEAQELVALATPEQVQGFLDLDVWKVDQLDDAAVRPWLDALIAAGPERLVFVWRQLDPDLTALILHRWVRIYQLAEEEVPDWEEPPFVPTPDRFFMLKVLSAEPDLLRTVEMLVDRLYRADPELARHTLRAAASEPGTELEEMSYRWKTGRLTDLGFAPLDEALEVYRPIDVAAVKIAEGTADAPGEVVSLPAIYAEPSRRGFFGRALARLPPDELARLEAALAVVLNRVLAANRVSPSDNVAAAAAAAGGAALLSLGLETVARGDVARAAEALRTISLVRLHRAGHTLTLQLARLARVLAPRAGRAEEPQASVLAALLRPRPQLARALDDPPDLGSRPFAAVADVRAATQALALLAAQVAIVRDGLGVDPAALGEAVTLGDVARTAMLRLLFGGRFDFAPLGVEDVRRFAASVSGGRIPEAGVAAIRAAARGALEAKKIAVPQECDRAVLGWIGDLERELGSLATDLPPDRRFIRGLVLE
jgi:hypothetical protein